MTRQIIRLLMEHQGFISSENLCNTLRQPLSIVNQEIQALNRRYPDLFVIKENQDKINLHFHVKIAPYGEHIARSLL